ncbi:hypothetical protein FIBSPDRAFT_960511 [Athelia psychrophila]|uniref:Autophagy-related protein 29 n=1 Tax=Athelia psychrophila TaxID=1759441 RepID=A0A166CAJ5_9AGAM|nr:hypothetical protein FIBSPDRAFT_960511 [Fibularhizoctonia sp. CBS 109695]
MPAGTSPVQSNIRVVVRLPYNRPEHPPEDPPKIQWNAEKAKLLWEVIARSRTSDSGGTDWKALAAHLEVPLPYLLYRAQIRYEDDLRGLQDITSRGALSPSATVTPRPEEFPLLQEKPAPVHQADSRTSALFSSSARMSGTALGVRARLTSLNASRPSKKASSSTLTVRGPALLKKNLVHLEPTSPSSSEHSTDSEEEEAEKEEEANRKAEEQAELDRKLKNLQQIITGEALGLVSIPQAKGRSKATARGRAHMSITSNSTTPRDRDDRGGELSSRSQSISSVSPHGSIPDIPSPSRSSPPPGSLSRSQSQPHSPLSVSQHLRPSSKPSKSSSPPALSARSARGVSHMRQYENMLDVAQEEPRGAGTSASEQESNQDSSASSFSDISDASLSASALESALMSNIRGGGSRLSAFARSKFATRGGGTPRY